MTRDATTAFARTLVDEWVRAGITDAVVSPGSRSAPIALALAEDGRIAVHVIIDERAAAFFALGLGRATGCPAIVVTTSGTAAANLHPAVLEAHHGRVPLIVCTADRPPELRDTGAPQTIDQINLYGRAVRWFVDAEVPADRPGAGAAWRALGACSVAAARGIPRGPVHLNLPLREPLVPTGAPLVDAPGRADGAPWTSAVQCGPTCPEPARLDDLAAWIGANERGLLVAGWGAGVNAATAARFARASGWPIIADPLSGLGAVPGAVGAYEVLVRAERFAAAHRPTAVLRVGAPVTSATLMRWLEDETETVVIPPDGQWRDPGHRAAEVVVADPETLVNALADRLESGCPDGSGTWSAAWHAAGVFARRAIDRVLDAWPERSEPRTARDVVAALPAGATLVVASSMPVRDVECFARARADVHVVSNRGVNGIDGFVSTALGVAVGTEGPVVALCGDLSFLHDGGGLLAARSTGARVVFVVVDNDGGGIFSFLPQAARPEHFETLFATPPRVDLAAIAAAHGFAVTPVACPADVGSVLPRAIASRGCQVLHVRTDRARNVEHHREVWGAVASVLSEQ